MIAVYRHSVLLRLTNCDIAHIQNILVWLKTMILNIHNTFVNRCLRSKVHSNVKCFKCITHYNSYRFDVQYNESNQWTLNNKKKRWFLSIFLSIDETGIVKIAHEFKIIKYPANIAFAANLSKKYLSYVRTHTYKQKIQTDRLL